MSSLTTTKWQFTWKRTIKNLEPLLISSDVKVFPITNQRHNVNLVFRLCLTLSLIPSFKLNWKVNLSLLVKPNTLKEGNTTKIRIASERWVSPPAVLTTTLDLMLIFVINQATDQGGVVEGDIPFQGQKNIWSGINCERKIFAQNKILFQGIYFQSYSTTRTLLILSTPWSKICPKVTNCFIFKIFEANSSRLHTIIGLICLARIHRRGMGPIKHDMAWALSQQSCHGGCWRSDFARVIGELLQKHPATCSVANRSRDHVHPRCHLFLCDRSIHRDRSVLPRAGWTGQLPTKASCRRKSRRSHLPNLRPPNITLYAHCWWKLQRIGLAKQKNCQVSLAGWIMWYWNFLQT